MDYRNKVIWITGASSGIGEALSLDLANRGAKLILSSRREEELNRVKNLCKNPADVHILPLDLMDIPSLESKAEIAVKLFGRIDMLINNGGISQRSLVVNTPLDIDRRIMEVNFFSYVALTKAILPYMIKQNYGYIIVTSSILGKIGISLRSAYASSKHALHGFFDSLREEVLHNNIKVVMACPGWIKTNVTINAITETGEPYNLMGDGQSKGMEAKKCAYLIIKAINRGKTEVYIGGYETFTVYFKRYLPALYLKVVRLFKTT
ncbi:MAG: SDR family oxidoreductase [Bacteroidetes bacterium]|nr:SDR family oxidoreductase [Bacteroidota bacterium]HET6243423.1 SDR family oxidoreductase [Bacteroidia bacterium]